MIFKPNCCYVIVSTPAIYSGGTMSTFWMGSQLLWSNFHHDIITSLQAGVSSHPVSMKVHSYLTGGCNICQKMWWFFSLLLHKRWTGGPAQPPLQCVIGVLSPGIMSVGVWSSSPFQVWNGWSLINLHIPYLCSWQEA